MNQPKINLQEVKIEGRSDILIVWNTKKYHCWKSLVKRGFDYEHNTKEWPLEVKRAWIYVNEPENKLLYITKVVYEGKKAPENLWDCDKCRNMTRELNNDSTLKAVYKLELLHIFEKGNSLPELQKYKNLRSRKHFFTPKPMRTPVYVDSYDLKLGIITGKIS